jgi:hypothetical protein
MAYRKGYRLAKLVYGIAAPVLGFPALPEPGHAFREMVINDFATEGRSPEILRALITHIYMVCRQEGYNMLMVGSDERDPILEATRGFFWQPLRSLVIFGSGDPDIIEKEGIDCSLPYLDIALT